jgi:hypothetical protein
MLNKEDLKNIETFDMLAFLRRQRVFSEKAFGPAFRYKGIKKHIEKELDEIEREPFDLEEWIDVVLLALDGAWRSGHTPEQILSMLEFKLTKNEGRDWPDYRTLGEDEAIEHIEKTVEYALVYFRHDLEDGWYAIQWPDNTVSEYNFWFNAQKEINKRGLEPKWGGPDSMNHYCPLK